MSTAVVPEAVDAIDSPEVVREKAGVERTAQLLAECQEKIRTFNTRLKDTKNRLTEIGELDYRRDGITADLTGQVKRYRPVLVAAEQLARYASGLVENARLPQLDKIELQLRNAELEAELIEARHLIG